MSYHVYTTPGIVLKSIPFGDAHKYFYILTKDLGLVIASAQSVRNEKSKLAHGLEDFSRSHFSFVRGKHSWKLTSVESGGNIYRLLPHRETKVLVARFASLICRLVNGEERSLELFGIAESLSHFLVLHKNLSPKELVLIESWAVLKLLHILGFVSPRPEYGDLLSSDFSIDKISRVLSVHRNVIKDINTALRASQV